MIEAKNITKKFGSKTVLKDLNIKVNAGEIFCLLGANGAGKTTLINIFLNFISADSGKAYINNIDVEKHPSDSKKHLAYIPENLMLYPYLTGIENLKYFTNLAGKKYTKEELELFLSEAGLQKNYIHKRVSVFSKGMRQKVGIAIALAKNAKVLLLDEPTSGLDLKSAKEFADILKKLKAGNVAVLMTTHDLFRAKETGTDIGILKDGKLIDKFVSEEINYDTLEKLYINHIKI